MTREMIRWTYEFTKMMFWIRNSVNLDWSIYFLEQKDLNFKKKFKDINEKQN